MKFRVCSRKFSKKIIDFCFLPMMQSWSISADFRLYDCFASLVCLLHSFMSSVFKDIQRSVVFAGCALLIVNTVQIVYRSILTDIWVWYRAWLIFKLFLPHCYLSFSFLCTDSLRTPLTLFSGALRPAGIRGSIRVFCGGRWRHTHGEKQSCLYCTVLLGIWIRIRRIRMFLGLRIRI